MKRSFISIFLLGLEIITGSLLLYSLRHLYTPGQLETRTFTNPVVNQSQAVPAQPASPQTAPQDGLVSEVSLALSSVFGPLPKEVPADSYKTSKAMIELGRHLWFEPRLSISGTMSCNTCHPLDNYGVDNLALSIGIDGKPVKRNSPTVYNAALHISQFWDGRTPTVEEQALEPVLSANEMGMLEPDFVEERLHSIPGYVSLFAEAFPDEPDPIKFENVGVAIGAFERGLLTPSRFDNFLAGDHSQLNEQEQKGLATFLSLRCASCHIGSTLGGLSYKRLGEHEPYPIEDLGRFNVTGVNEDKYVFKVPSLRNVAKTAPYMHDGSVQTLDEMVRLMARHQLGKEVTDQEVADVVAFLNTLTGEIPQEYIKQPELFPEADEPPAQFSRGNSDL